MSLKDSCSTITMIPRSEQDLTTRYCFRFCLCPPTCCCSAAFKYQPRSTCNSPRCIQILSSSDTFKSPLRHLIPVTVRRRCG
ncbi:uncharacterized protein LY89DRAFT_97288 [Mollisia scopiformis]|uniref:Uncharacterized protein n=1 Tax=Mollisia scopiformis TaxID=149040 RepID=A0A194X7Q6_MOLSC|nr:uncharacterized protein LY89DRAFT_97288 [Mollisia scopiformis]KUJ15837.1 hypothetical protein LY89DRAFT_97288 [Mollisia scopiformis]